jgi:hypothetical protein
MPKLAKRFNYIPIIVMQLERSCKLSLYKYRPLWETLLKNYSYTSFTILIIVAQNFKRCSCKPSTDKYTKYNSLKLGEQIINPSMQYIVSWLPAASRPCKAINKLHKSLLLK